MSINKKYLFLFLCLFFNLVGKVKHSFTLVLDPAGNSFYPGRIIDETFERGITLQYVEYLQKVLEHRLPSLKILITRTLGERSQAIENASFSNRMKAHLFIHFNFYQKKSPLPLCNVYYFCKNKLTDSWQFTQPKISFISYNCTHLDFFSLTKKLASKSIESLQEKYSSLLISEDAIGLPFAPLLGVHCPALAFEISLNTKNDWSSLVLPLADTIESLITIIKKEEKNA